MPGTSETGTSEFKLGLQHSIPIVLGYLPVSIAFGVLAANYIGENSIMMSAFVFAGASQFAALQMMIVSSSAAFIVFTTFLINLRHILMGSYLNTYHKDSNALKKLLIAFGITDETFAISTGGFRRNKIKNPFIYQLTLNTASYLSWVSGTIVGYFIGQIMPEQLVEVLPFTLTALFLYLLTISIERKLDLAVACVAAVISILVLNYSIGWNIFVATLVACFFGVRLEKTVKRS